MSMQHDPQPCTCGQGRHAFHCGDCGAPARPVKQLDAPRERIVVCLDVAGCGRLRRIAHPG